LLDEVFAYQTSLRHDAVILCDEIIDDSAFEAELYEFY